MENMKKVYQILMVFSAVLFSLNLTAQTHNHGSTQTPNSGYQPNAKNVEIASRFVYYLDNGFEQIDLLKVPSINKQFFNLGNPKLVIYDKNDKSKKNLLVSFTLMVEPNIPDFHGKAYQNFNQFFTNNCRQAVTACPKGSKITFVEVRLSTTLPQAVQQAPGSKHVLPMGMLPVAFYLMIE
jgi:hypothetical protein